MLRKGLYELSIDQVQLDKDNPRIKQALEIHGGEITAKIISLALNGGGTDAYKSLHESIRISKGIIHPIVVSEEKDGTYVVIEGNTRLQIYKDFYNDTHDAIWAKIQCLVYAEMTDVDKHDIRLQSHLIGPREWDAYSKAKYLYQLSEIEYWPMDSIVAKCGGKASEVRFAIEAYKCMKNEYKPIMEQKGLDFDAREYSKFFEYLKNTKCKDALFKKDFSSKDFALWVADGKIDNAQKVRQIPAIFNNKEAYDVFLKKKLTDADQALTVSNYSEDPILEKIPYEILCQKLIDVLDHIQYKEIKALANDDSYLIKKNALTSLLTSLEDTVEEIKNHEA